MPVLKGQAKSTFGYMAMVNKDCMKYAGNDLMELVIKGEYYDLIYNFSTLPEMYTNTPEAIHNNLDSLFSAFPFMNISGIIYNVSKKHLEELIPYVDQLIPKLETESMVGSLILVMLAEVSALSPDTIYPHIQFILIHCKSISSGEYALSTILGNVAKASSPPDVADEMFVHLVDMLSVTDNAVLVSILMQISNIKTLLSSIDVLQEKLPIISKHKTSNELVVTEIEDYASG